MKTSRMKVSKAVRHSNWLALKVLIMIISQLIVVAMIEHVFVSWKSTYFISFKAHALFYAICCISQTLEHDTKNIKGRSMFFVYNTDRGRSRSSAKSTSRHASVYYSAEKMLKDLWIFKLMPGQAYAAKPILFALRCVTPWMRDTTTMERMSKLKLPLRFETA